MPRPKPGQEKNVNHKPRAVPGKFRPGFLDAMDKRTELYKLLRSRLDAITEDLGGVGEISLIKATIIEKFCWIQAHLETIEAELALGEVEREAVMGKWIQGVNSLVGLAKMLGLERTKSVESLGSYLATKNAPPQKIAKATTSRKGTLS